MCLVVQLLIINIELNMASNIVFGF